MNKTSWSILSLILALLWACPPAASASSAPAKGPEFPFLSQRPYLEAVFPAGFTITAPDPAVAQSLLSARHPRGAVVVILARQLQQALDLDKQGPVLIRLDQEQVRSGQGVTSFGITQPARLGITPVLTYTYSLAGREHRRLLAVAGGWFYTLDLGAPPAAQQDLIDVLSSLHLVPQAGPTAPAVTAAPAPQSWVPSAPPAPVTAPAAPAAAAPPASAATVPAPPAPDPVADLRPLLGSLDPPRLAQAMNRASQALASSPGEARLQAAQAEAAALQVLVARAQRRPQPVGDLSRLADQARAAASSRRDDADAQRAWGLVLLATDRAGEAEEVLERAVKLGPGRGDNHLALALWYGFDPAAQEARARRALELEPGLTGAAWLLAQALDRQNKSPQAESLLADLLARDPRHSLGLAALGGLEMERAPASAQARLELALKLDPSNTSARFNLALALKRAGRAAEAEAELDKLLGVDPRDASALNLRGQLQQEQGRAAQARQSFEAATKADPRHAGAFYNLGALCAGALKDPACAKAAFTRFVELEPSGPRSQRVRDWLARQGN